MKSLIDILDSDTDSDFELPRRPSLVAKGFSSFRRSCRKVTRSMAKITFTKAGFKVLTIGTSVILASFSN